MTDPLGIVMPGDIETSVGLLVWLLVWVEAQPAMSIVAAKSSSAALLRE